MGLVDFAWEGKRTAVDNIDRDETSGHIVTEIGTCTGASEVIDRLPCMRVSYAFEKATPDQWILIERKEVLAARKASVPLGVETGPPSRRKPP